MKNDYTLYILNEQNQQEKLLEGCNKYCLFAFFSNQYENDMENEKGEYITTIKQVLLRLDYLQTRLHVVSRHMFSYEMEGKFEELDRIVYSLKDFLKGYPLYYKLKLNRWEIFKNEEELQSQVLENESDIAAFEQFYMSFDEVMRSYKESLPNETITNYHLSIRDGMGWLEHGRGPNIITELFNELYENKVLHSEIDNPQVFFSLMMEKLATSVGSESRVYLEYMKTLHITIEEALRYPKN